MVNERCLNICSCIEDELRREVLQVPHTAPLADLTSRCTVMRILVFFSHHPDRTLIQLGFALSGSTVSEISIGGPAYTSRQLSVGDVILEVDNIQATEANINHLLRGCDVPGSPVMIMAAKGGVQVFDCISCVSYLTIAKTYRVHVSTSRLFEWHLKT